MAGFVLDEVVTDDGVSGVTTKLAERAGGRRLFDLLRSGDTLVVRWVDRLGRNYEDVSDNIRAFMRRGVVIKTIINGMSFDGAATDPMTQAVRDALIGFMAALSQAQAEATKEAHKAGIAHAKAREDKVYLGRKPSFTVAQVTEVISLIGEGKGVTQVAKQLDLSRGAIYRIQKCPADAFASVRASS
jgi:DNA invertase Pin-like site-specific DNA recombinase